MANPRGFLLPAGHSEEVFLDNLGFLVEGGEIFSHIFMKGIYRKLLNRRWIDIQTTRAYKQT